MTSSFSKKLLKWHESIDRELPWKSTKDPYKIWLSEVILQQTRVEQGTPYYLKFIDLFPTVQDLANATEEQVLLAWQGLGYYSRARNLHFAAKTIVSQYSGIFPSTYDEIRALKGVGDYTAAAIASFAYDLPYVVLDGNVKRVVARYFGITDPIDQTQTIQALYTKLNSLFSPNHAASFNQAIMDFGALQCTPANPDCITCPFSNVCVANQKELTKIIPFKSKKIKKTIRYLHYLVITDGKKTFINKRREKDIWQGLYDFPLIESTTNKVLTNEAINAFLEKKFICLNQQDLTTERIPLKKHILSHQTIYVTIYKLRSSSKITTKKKTYHEMDNANHHKYAFPVIISKHIDVIIEK